MKMNQQQTLVLSIKTEVSDRMHTSTHTIPNRKALPEKQGLTVINPHPMNPMNPMNIRISICCEKHRVTGTRLVTEPERRAV